MEKSSKSAKEIYKENLLKVEETIEGVAEKNLLKDFNDLISALRLQLEIAREVYLLDKEDEK